MTKLRYLSNATLETLRTHITENIARYRDGNFLDLLPQSDWSIELALDVNLSSLRDLDPSGDSEAEIANSRLVWRALAGLTPNLACEEGIWVRLTHIECLTYARSRWLAADMNDEQIAKAVADHFFANTLTKRRDDNAISRLWWNAYIAGLALPGPELKALDVFLKKADLRSNFVERSLIVSRPVLAAGIVRIMQRNPSVSTPEENFRKFMRTVNRLGGGIVFEAKSDAEVDTFMDICAVRAGIITATDT